MLQSMELPRVRQDLATEQQQKNEAQEFYLIIEKSDVLSPGNMNKESHNLRTFGIYCRTMKDVSLGRRSYSGSQREEKK